MSGDHYHVDITESATELVRLLQDASGLPKQRIKHAMTSGAVWLTRGKTTTRVRRSSRKLNIGDCVDLYYDERVLAEQPIPAELIHDGRCYSVWDKPAGVRSQGSRWGDHCTIVRYAERHFDPNRTAFTVHRLDRAASGLIVVAHTRRAAANLSAQFRRRTIEKVYRCWVVGRFAQDNEPAIVEQPIDEKSAHSEFSCIHYDPERDCSMLEVRIRTGRKHQIRRHAAGLGFPIVGDRLHGNASATDPNLRLRAVALAFDCPERNEPLKFELTQDFPSH